MFLTLQIFIRLLCLLKLKHFVNDRLNRARADEAIHILESRTSSTIKYCIWFQGGIRTACESRLRYHEALQP